MTLQEHKKECQRLFDSYYHDKKSELSYGLWLDAERKYCNAIDLHVQPPIAQLCTVAQEIARQEDVNA